MKEEDENIIQTNQKAILEIGKNLKELEERVERIEEQLRFVK